MGKIIEIKIDWSIFDEDPEMTIYCCCGAIFRSHAKFKGKPINKMISRKACPKCGANCDFKKISSDPEIMTL